MDEIKKISLEYLQKISAEQQFNLKLIIKDYYITLILFLLKNMAGMYFKGGTALQKMFLDYSRLSEDIDFTVIGDMQEIKAQIEKKLDETRMFGKITKDKHVEGFLRLVVPYKFIDGEEGTVFIDLNKRAKISFHPETHIVSHFYKEHIPPFSVQTVALREMIAEKMAATIGRNKPRDHFDLYKIIEKKLEIDVSLVKKKCIESGVEFNIIKMFNNGQKLHKRWHQDMVFLLKEDIPFQKVMQTLSTHFKLKEEKDKMKKTKQEKNQ